MQNQPTHRLYPGFPPPSDMVDYAARTDPMMRRHCMANASTNLLGGLEDGLCQARAEAALVAGMDMKPPTGPPGMFKPDMIAAYHTGAGLAQPPHSQPGMPRVPESAMNFFGPPGTSQATMHMPSPVQHYMTGGPQFTQYSPYPIAPMTASHHAFAAAGAAVSHSLTAVTASSFRVQTMPTTGTGDPDTDPRELENFAEHFKQRRIKLSVTQADVGKALANLKLPGVGSLSQSTICRFESLTLSHNNMVALKPILEAWLSEAEKGPRDDRKRKRTSIPANEKRTLEAYFRIQPRPSSEKIAAIAEQLDLKKGVVRVWFCNRRQKEKRLRSQRSFS